MSDGIALPGLALLAIGLVALAMVWPQGQGARSPAPFGHSAAVMAGSVVLRGPEAPKPTPKSTPKLAPSAHP